MIVADVNLITYLLVDGESTPFAERVFEIDSEWVAPAIWRHEFLNVMATLVRGGVISLHKALEALQKADHLVSPPDAVPADDVVLRLAVESKHATYDCEFIALAQDLGLYLVTNDRKLREKFRLTALSLEEFAAKHGRSITP